MALGSSRLIDDDIEDNGSECAETASTLSQSEYEADISAGRAVVEIGSRDNDEKVDSGNSQGNNVDVVCSQETNIILRSKSRTWADSAETLVGTQVENAIDLTRTPPKRRRKS